MDSTSAEILHQLGHHYCMLNFTRGMDVMHEKYWYMVVCVCVVLLQYCVQRPTNVSESGICNVCLGLGVNADLKGAAHQYSMVNTTQSM